MMSEPTIQLKIADFILDLTVPNDVPFILDRGFEGFVLSKQKNKQSSSDITSVMESGKADLSIKCHVGCANAPKSWKEEIYSAKNGDVALWKIFNTEDGICLHVFDAENLSHLQHIAFYREDLAEWTIFTDLNESQSLESLRYPMMPLILYYLSTKSNSLLVHASGIFDGEYGRIFSGFSGVGKSTMAGIWQISGAEVINDDRLMLRKIDGRWWMFNTPMYYSDVPKKAPLDFIYLPFHSAENTYERGNGMPLFLRFMAHCIQHGYNAQHVQWHLDQVLDLGKEIPFTRLGVVPSAEVVTFIKEHEKSR
jgi:hypothetical protein